MNTRLWICALLASGLLAGCAGSAGDSRIVNVTLNATPANQGQAGMAVFVDKGDETGLDFTIGGVPSGVSTPLQLQAFIYPGACGSLAAQPAYSLNQDTQAAPGQAGWVMSKVVPVSLNSLIGGNYAVTVRTSPADGNLTIFCGNIR